MGNLKIPDGLSPEAAKLYRRTVRDYGSGRPPGFVIELETCCRTLDRLRAAESTLRTVAATFLDSSGKPMAHPATQRIDAEGRAFERQMGGVRKWISEHHMALMYRAVHRSDRGTGASLGRTNSVSEEDGE